MCGRFTFTEPWQKLYEQLKAIIGDVVVGDGVAEQPGRYNIAPTQPIAVIFQSVDPPRNRKAELMRWGLVPVWVKDPREFSLIINARVETILEKPSFKGGLRHHRCLVPASGYYEWQKQSSGAKQPFHITNADGAPLFMAGIYSTWLGASGEEIDTVALITVPANDDVKSIHDRMPTLILPQQADKWLDITNVSEAEAYAMLRPALIGQLKSEPVSTRVNSNRVDGPELIVPVTPEKPEPKPKKPTAQLDLF